jgi:hypothetical protein
MARQSGKAKKRGSAEPSRVPPGAALSPSSQSGHDPSILLSVERTAAPSDEALIAAIARLALANLRAKHSGRDGIVGLQ